MRYSNRINIQVRSHIHSLSEWSATQWQPLSMAVHSHKESAETNTSSICRYSKRKGFKRCDFYFEDKLGYTVSILLGE